MYNIILHLVIYSVVTEHILIPFTIAAVHMCKKSRCSYMFIVFYVKPSTVGILIVIGSEQFFCCYLYFDSIPALG
jgi:hypothetical protein